MCSSDLAVGNIVGSNIFNIFGVLGLTSVVAPGGVAVSPVALNFDVPVMIAVALACLPVFFTGHLLARWEGGLLFGYYIAYTAYLVMHATQHDLLSTYRWAMLGFTLPLTAITLIVVARREWLARRSGGPGTSGPAVSTARLAEETRQ